MAADRDTESQFEARAGIGLACPVGSWWDVAPSHGLSGILLRFGWSSLAPRALRCDFGMRWILLNVPSSRADIARALVALLVTSVIRVQIILGKYRAGKSSTYFDVVNNIWLVP